MNFEEFKQQLMEDLKKYLPIEVGAGVEIAENAVKKLQHESYAGITVKKEDSEIGINMDASRLYADLEQGKSYEDVFHYAVDIVQRGFDDVPKVDIAKFLDYEAMKETLTMQVIPISGNEEMLHNIPHKEVEDLAIVYRFSVAQEDSGIATILIKNDLLERYGITAEQLHTDACEFAPIREQVSIKNMTEVLAEMMGPEFGEMLNEMPMGDGPAMYVATNDSKVNGASVMMYPGFMEEAAEKTGGECLGLCWNDLDFEKRIIKVCKTLTYRPEPDNGSVVHISTPKTEAGERTIPMIDEVYDAFLEEYQIQKVLGFGTNEIDGFRNFVFSTGEGKNLYAGICESCNQESL